MTALSQQCWIPPPAQAAGPNPAHDTGPAAPTLWRCSGVLPACPAPHRARLRNIAGWVCGDPARRNGPDPGPSPRFFRRCSPAHVSSVWRALDFPRPTEETVYAAACLQGFAGCCGEVAEWFKAAVLKTAVRESVPWVRIPPSPPNFPIVRSVATGNLACNLVTFGTPSRLSLQARM